MNIAIHIFYFLTLLLGITAIWIPILWIFTAIAIGISIILTLKEQLTLYEIAKKIIITIAIFLFLIFVLNKNFPIGYLIGSGLCICLYLTLLIIEIINTRRIQIQKIEKRRTTDNNAFLQVKVKPTQLKIDIPKTPQYEKKKLMTECEKNWYKAIQPTIPINYTLRPQICLASIINKDYGYGNELFRIIDFGVFDHDGNIKLLIEINDKSHFQSKRMYRDVNVHKICEQANIPLITFWTNSPMEYDYISTRIKPYL